MDDILGDNTIEDTSWLCSLSESELDMLISLKMLVLQRAKIIGHEKLANRFDLKMLRAFGLILMEYVKQQTTDASLIPSMANPAALLENCNLLKTDLQEIMRLDEIMTCIATDSKKRREKRYVYASFIVISFVNDAGPGTGSLVCANGRGSKIREVEKTAENGQEFWVRLRG